MDSTIPSGNETKSSIKSSQPYKQFKGEASSLADKAERAVEGIDFEGSYEMVRERAGDVYESSVEFIKKYPVSTLLGATVIGYIAGALARRR